MFRVVLSIFFHAKRTSLSPVPFLLLHLISYILFLFSYFPSWYNLLVIRIRKNDEKAIIYGK